MDVRFHLPDDPLERFAALHDALLAERACFEASEPRRLAALVLVTTAGEPRALAEDALALARELRRRSPWHGPLRDDLRHVVAAMLLRAGDDAKAFVDELGRARALFRELGLRSSGYQHVLAVLALRATRRGSDGRPAALRSRDVERLARLRAALAADHPYLTGEDDHAACAVLAAGGEEPAAIAARAELLYRGLRARRYSAGNCLQAATHLLALGEERTHRLVERFDALFQTFRRKGLRMHAGDLAEVALLALLDSPPAEVAERVLAHRGRIARLSPRPSREASFDLACGTAFLALLGGREPVAGARFLKAVVHLQAMLRARRTLILAAASGAAISAGS